MKTYPLDQVQHKLIGKVCTPNRDNFEYGFKMYLIEKAIKKKRKESKFTQEELLKLICVQKTQILRIESKASNASIFNLMPVLKVLYQK